MHVWLVLIAGIFSCGLTYGIWRLAESRRIHDEPNERSMHTSRLAIGAGWAIVAAVLVLWPWTDDLMRVRLGILIGAMLVLAVISWLDDLHSLPPLWRLLVQACVVGVCLFQLPQDASVLGGWLPRWIERLLTGICWLWFINLYNFMDGIDGITGGETVSIAIGYIVVAALAGYGASHSNLAAILIGASLGFLVWNWHPARIILGDVGSIPLGFLLGWLMIDLALRGHLAAALILPLHHIADATFTLAKRILTVPEPWKPHRQHVYQRAVLGGFSVPQVVLRITLLNAALIVLAALSLRWPWTALALAAAATLAQLGYLARVSPGMQVR